MGLARWPIAYSGHCARRFVWKTCISVSILILFYLFSFHYTLIYIPNNSQAMMRMMHVSFLANMSIETSHKHVLPCMSHAMRCQHICSYLFNKHVFLGIFFKPLDRMSKNGCNDSVTLVRSFLFTVICRKIVKKLEAQSN